MIRGLDTTFLVQTDVLEHTGHRAARDLLHQLLTAGDTLGITPQVLFEYIHMVTDNRRFENPLPVEQAIVRAELWWNSKEVVHVMPTDESVRLSLEWLRRHRLGRKRLLDTQLAATYYCNGIRSILSTNVRDFSTFGCFEVIAP